MRRKLIKQGGGGLTFYVPKEWAEARGLKAGDEVNVDDIDGRLILSTDGLHHQKEVQIDLSKKSREFIRNSLNQLYRQGYDRITVRSSTKENLLVAQKFVSMFLLGFEITNADERTCVAENVSEPSTDKQDVIVRRSFLLIKECFGLLESDISSGKLTSMSDIYHMAKKITQYDNFCRKGLIGRNLATGESFFLWELLSILSLISHSFFHLYRRGEAIGKEKAALLDDVRRVSANFAGIYKAYFAGDLSAINDECRTANELLDSLIGSKEAAANMNLYHSLREIARLNYLICTPMIGMLGAKEASSQDPLGKNL